MWNNNKFKKFQSEITDSYEKDVKVVPADLAILTFHASRLQNLWLFLFD